MDYYEILEVSRNASKEVIEKAYKTLAKKYHPDLYQGKARIQAENKIKDINEAYSILKDVGLKEKYDNELNSQKKESSVESIEQYATKEILEKFNQYDNVLRSYAEYIDKMNNILINVYGNIFAEPPEHTKESEEEIKQRIAQLKKMQKTKNREIFIKKLVICIFVGLVFFILPTVREFSSDIIKFIKK